jgi:TonB family protein
MKAEPTVHWTTLGLLSLLALGPTSCASTHPRTGAELAAAKLEWSSQVRAQIRYYWNPWDVVRTVTAPIDSAAWRATTVLRIAVQTDGTAPQPEIVGSSGVAALDEEAVRAVAAALPLPAPPSELASGASPVPLVLGFRVVRNEDPKVAPGDDVHDPFAVITAGLESRTAGVVDPLDIQRTVETYRQDVSMCLGRQRDTGFEAIGEVAIEWVITETGSVQHPVVVKTRGLNRSLEGCLVQAISLWSFRKPTGGPAKVMFPFRFGGGLAAGADFRSEQAAPTAPKLSH